MRKALPWIIALAAFTGLMLFAQSGPIVTGGFLPASTAPSATLILLNQSRLADSTLAELANALDRKVLNVALATRLAGPQTAVCGAGEWCLPITDQMLCNVSDVATGALIGAEITREIVRGSLK
jgi:hypothetical protein